MKSLEQEMSAGDFWLDRARAERVSREAADLRHELEVWEKFLKELDDLKELGELSQKEPGEAGSGTEEMYDEMAARLREFEAYFSRLEFTTLFSGAHDRTAAIL